MDKKELIKEFKEVMDLGERWDGWVDALFEQHPNFSNLDEMFRIFIQATQPAMNAMANRILNHQLGIE